jgi:hypothetical protein
MVALGHAMNAKARFRPMFRWPRASCCWAGLGLSIEGYAKVTSDRGRVGGHVISRAGGVG